MNAFLNACIRLVSRHGMMAGVVQVTEGAYNVETLSTVNTEIVHKVKLFKNHIKSSQYNYPNLIGRDAAEFYLVNDCITFKPSIRDKIQYGTDVYTIDNIQEHHALGVICLYTVVAVKN